MPPSASSIDPEAVRQLLLEPVDVTVERGRVAFFARAIGEGPGVHDEPELARSAGHPDVLVPPTFFFTIENERREPFGNLRRLGLDPAHILHGAQSFRYHRPVFAGDRIEATARFVDSYSKRDGALQFLVRHSEFRRGGDLVAEGTSTLVVVQPSAAPRETTPPGTPGPLVPESSGAALPLLSIAPVSRATLALFAGASGDHNPVHLDIDFARAAGYDDVFAHGMLSMAWLGRLLTESFDQSRIESFGVRFAARTPIHAEPTCRVTAVETSDGRLQLALEIRLADGTVTVTGEAVVLVGSSDSWIASR